MCLTGHFAAFSEAAQILRPSKNPARSTIVLFYDFRHADFQTLGKYRVETDLLLRFAQRSCAVMSAVNL